MSYALIALAAALALFIAYRKGVFWPKEPEGWFAGPIRKGKNVSRNVKVAGEGFAFPVGKDGIHYFTKARGPITGEVITLRYRIDAEPGVQFVGVEDGAPATMSLYFAAKEIDWQGGFSRWYCPIEYRVPVKAGEHTLTVPLDGLWMGATDANSGNSPAQFKACLAQEGRIGVVFGGNAGRGHGAYATGPASFRLLSLEVLP